MNNQKMCVMVIDDNEAMRFGLKMLMEQRGFSVFCCSEGRTALAVIKQKKFDAYVIDYRMPEMNGAEVTVELRKMQPDAFIVGFSAESKESAFLNAGANKFLTKEQLGQELIELLINRKPVPTK